MNLELPVPDKKSVALAARGPLFERAKFNHSEPLIDSFDKKAPLVSFVAAYPSEDPETVYGKYSKMAGDIFRKRYSKKDDDVILDNNKKTVKFDISEDGNKNETTVADNGKNNCLFDACLKSYEKTAGGIPFSYPSTTSGEGVVRISPSSQKLRLMCNDLLKTEGMPIFEDGSPAGEQYLQAVSNILCKRIEVYRNMKFVASVKHEDVVDEEGCLSICHLGNTQSGHWVHLERGTTRRLSIARDEPPRDSESSVSITDTKDMKEGSFSFENVSFTATEENSDEDILPMPQMPSKIHQK